MITLEFRLSAHDPFNLRSPGRIAPSVVLKHVLWIYNASLLIFGLFGQIAWVIENMYFNVFLYNTISGDTAMIAAMVSASAVTATVTTLVMGALSDKLGKRKLFICGGYLCWGVSIWAFAALRMQVLQPLVGSAAMAASLGVGIELNENLKAGEESIVLRPYHIAKECGCKFYLGSDAHTVGGLENALSKFQKMIDALALDEEDKFSFVR